MVNNKVSIKVVNNTKYFIPGKDKLYNSFPNNNCHYLKRLKIESFEARLYWQFRYCQSLGCPTFYYTLTYSDKNIPYKYGTFCFDYMDLRDLFTGGFRKRLQRDFGLTFKYFVGAELGEGAGSRGLQNNPHYHILFFLEPFKDSDYKVISPLEFRHLIRLYWQGFDEDEGFRDYRKDCKYGICKEGLFYGEVKDFRAVSYVSKYVTKDVRLKMKEVDIEKFCHFHFNRELRNSEKFHHDFFNEIVKPKFFVPPFEFDKICLSHLLPDLSYFQVFYGFDMFPEDTFIHDCMSVVKKYGLWNDYFDFLSLKVEELTKEKINEWRNRFSNKPRISHNVGVYAFDFIDDLNNPRIIVPSKDGFKSRQLPLYYYRKLCKSVVREPKEETFSNHYISHNSVSILNENGIYLKMVNLETRIASLSDKTKYNFLFVVDKVDLFNLIRQSDINLYSWIDYQTFMYRYRQFFDLFQDGSIFRKYAIYHLVYEDRHFDFRTGEMPEIDYKNDFLRFLQPSIFSVPWSDLRVDSFIDSDNLDFLLYSDHVEFHKYMSLFDLFSLLNDYFMIHKDNKNEKEYNERDKVRSFHSSINLNYL